jgi:protein TonB
VRRLDRNVAITGSVVVFHIAALWALQTGLMRRAVEIIVPVEMISELLSPPAPKVEPQPTAPAPQPVKRAVRESTPPLLPLAIPDARPSPNAPTGVPVAPTAPAAVAPPAAVPAPAAPAKLEPPSSQADYLHNPTPPYPSLSKRLGERGTVMLRVFVQADGTPQKAEVAQTSGFDRLDQAAVNGVMKWRFVPGKRAGVPEAGWCQVPVQFILE